VIRAGTLYAHVCQAYLLFGGQEGFGVGRVCGVSVARGMVLGMAAGGWGGAWVVGWEI
jgi:hypothetical protein